MLRAFVFVGGARSRSQHERTAPHAATSGSLFLGERRPSEWVPHVSLASVTAAVRPAFWLHRHACAQGRRPFLAKLRIHILVRSTSAGPQPRARPCAACAGECFDPKTVEPHAALAAPPCACVRVVPLLATLRLCAGGKAPWDGAHARTWRCIRRCAVILSIMPLEH